MERPILSIVNIWYARSGSPQENDEMRRGLRACVLQLSTGADFEDTPTCLSEKSSFISG